MSIKLKIVPCIFWMFCVASQQLWAQIVIPLPGNTNDQLSMPHYVMEKQKAIAMTAIETAGVTAMGTAFEVIDQEHRALTTINGSFATQKTALTNFIYRTSLGYIRQKYSFVPSGFKNKNSFGNVVKVALFRRKLTLEKNLIDTYVAADNPITEGKRIYLILCSIENVMKATLKTPEDENM